MSFFLETGAADRISIQSEEKHCFRNKMPRMSMIHKLTSESQGKNFAEDITIVIVVRNNILSVISAR